MSKRLFKTMAAVLAIAAAAAGPVRGQTSQTSTLNFTDAYGSGPATANDGVQWTVTSDGAESSYDATKGIHYGTGTAQVQYIQLSTSGIEGTITQVKVNASTASNVNATVGVTVGGNAFGGDAQSLSSSAADYTFTGSATGTIVVRVAKTAAATKALYVKSIVVTYTPASSGGGSTPAVPHTVTFAEGTEDVGNWSITPAAAATTGVTAGTVVTVKYNGTRRINSIEAMVDGPSLTTPLTIEALTAGNILVNMDDNLSTGMKYSVNGGEKTLITTTTTIDVNAGDKVQFYGNGTSTTEYGNFPEVNLKGTAQTKVYGNIMSLLDETGYETATAISGNYVFYGLFSNNANLKDASGLLLPATTLAENCYSNMFHGCTGLTEAPALPAPTLVGGCYYSMFYGCNNLASVTCLATSGINASSSTSYWLQNAGTDQSVTTKTFNAVSSAEWPTSVNGIPEGWTRQAIGAQSTPEPVTLVPTGNTNEWTLTMPADNMLLMVNYAPAVPITIRMAAGTEDAANWSLASGNAQVPGNQVLENVMSGSQVTATYNGTTKKVKSVKAVKYVAPAATVTTEPTATGAIIEAGSTAALVNAGAASGGTMMYAVTTTNVQPASTAGFSASVPTAQGRTAGTYYVWFYVEGDASHTDSEIAGSVSVTVTSAPTTVTWNSSNISDLSVSGTYQSYTKESITLSANADMIDAFWMGYGDESGISFNVHASGGFTFTAPSGKKFTKIEMTLAGQGGWNMTSLGTGWAYAENFDPMTMDDPICKVTWTGSAASTVGLLTGTDDFGGTEVKSIVFTLIDAQ